MGFENFPLVSVGFENIPRVSVGFENFDVHFWPQFWPNFIKKEQKQHIEGYQLKKMVSVGFETLAGTRVFEVSGSVRVWVGKLVPASSSGLSAT